MNPLKTPSLRRLSRISMMSVPAVALLIASVFPACGGSDEESLALGPTYSSIRANILVPYRCISCHASEGGPTLETYADVAVQATAGDAANSPLYTSVLSGTMPKNAAPLSTEQVNAIRDWINAGASEN